MPAPSYLFLKFFKPCVGLESRRVNSFKLAVPSGRLKLLRTEITGLFCCCCFEEFFDEIFDEFFDDIFDEFLDKFF